ncbi:hypothetical protein SEPCBS57363_003466 [Sporothrix epigloea]|uniref:Cytochrome P450 n=1 Tax=Sporothrix epigloea TaxID=1892477 RepID=A0ABP0DPD6_9PEZI
MIAANVSALHRDIDIWGADAMAFRPDRFDVNMSTEQKQAYLPFGLTPHLCPAFHGFGERIILLLVALLSARLGPKTATIKYNDAQPDANLDSELPTGRYDMEDWALYLRMGDKTNEYHQK